MASRVVLATLAIPMPPNRPEIDRLVETDENVIDKNHRLLSTLLGLPNPPSRVLLIKDLVRFGIIHSAPTQLQDLYRWLETEFHPLKLCSRVQQSFDFLMKWEEFPELRQYIPSIQDITVVRLVKEVSQVYQTMKFSRLLSLTPFVEPFTLEYLIVQISRRNDLKVRIDHRKQCFHFGSELNVSQREIIEGPHLQSMPSEQLRNQLVYIHSVLNKAVNFVQPDKMRLERKELSKEIVKAYALTSSKDHMRILNRQAIIEERKEMLENLNYQKEAEERKLVEDKQQKLREAEKERMARETEERTKQRQLREQTELKRKVVMEKIEQLKKTEIGSRIFEGMDEEALEKLDPDDLLNKQVEQLDRERKELQTKLRKQERKVDHLERAKRIEEVPLLQTESEEYKRRDFEFWQQYEKEKIKGIKEERALAVQYRDRLMRLKEDRDNFLQRLKTSRASVYEEKSATFKKVIEEERKKRLATRKEKRREERRAQWLKEKEEKRQLLIDEQLKREREEALAKLEEIEAKKRAKELEIEERLRQEKEAVAALALERKQEEEGKATKDLPPKPRSWREQEAEKEGWRPSFERKDLKPAAEEESSWRKKSDDRDRESLWRRKAKDGPEDEKPRPFREDSGERSWRKADDRDRRIPDDRDRRMTDDRDRREPDDRERRVPDDRERRVPDDRDRRVPDDRDRRVPDDRDRRVPDDRRIDWRSGKEKDSRRPMEEGRDRLFRDYPDTKDRYGKADRDRDFDGRDRFDRGRGDRSDRGGVDRSDRGGVRFSGDSWRSVKKDEPPRSGGMSWRDRDSRPSEDGAEKRREIPRDERKERSGNADDEGFTRVKR